MSGEVVINIELKWFVCDVCFVPFFVLRLESSIKVFCWHCIRPREGLPRSPFGLNAPSLYNISIEVFTSKERREQ